VNKPTQPATFPTKFLGRRRRLIVDGRSPHDGQIGICGLRKKEFGESDRLSACQKEAKIDKTDFQKTKGCELIARRRQNRRRRQAREEWRFSIHGHLFRAEVLSSSKFLWWVFKGCSSKRLPGALALPSLGKQQSPFSKQQMLAGNQQIQSESVKGQTNGLVEEIIVCPPHSLTPGPAIAADCRRVRRISSSTKYFPRSVRERKGGPGANPKQNFLRSWRERRQPKTEQNEPAPRNQIPFR
jgi:hypothetical protein